MSDRELAKDDAFNAFADEIAAPENEGIIIKEKDSEIESPEGLQFDLKEMMALLEAGKYDELCQRILEFLEFFRINKFPYLKPGEKKRTKEALARKRNRKKRTRDVE